MKTTHYAYIHERNVTTTTTMTKSKTTRTNDEREHRFDPRARRYRRGIFVANRAGACPVRGKMAGLTGGDADPARVDVLRRDTLVLRGVVCIASFAESS